MAKLIAAKDAISFTIIVQGYAMVFVTHFLNMLADLKNESNENLGLESWIKLFGYVYICYLMLTNAGWCFYWYHIALIIITSFLVVLPAKVMLRIR